MKKRLPFEGQTKNIFGLVFILFNLCSGILTSYAAETLPDFDIVLFQLHQQDGTFSIDKPQVIAQSLDYDNQPRFSPDGKSVYFTHMHDQIANIWRWDMIENKASAFAVSPFSEYSPMPIPTMPGYLSTVRVEADGTQRLWKYNDNAGYSLLFSDIKPIGYHAWSGNNIALFVLGEPHQLQVTQLGSSEVEIADTKIGRCLQTAPQGNAITYTVETDSGWLVKSYDIDNHKSKSIITLPKGGEDYVWFDNQKIIASDGNQLFSATIGEQANWQSIKNKTKFELSEISRLAISPDGSYLAVVYIKSSSSK